MTENTQALQILTKKNTAVLTDKIKALQIFTHEEGRVTDNMWALEQLSSEKTQGLGKATTGKSQALEKFIKTDNKIIQTQTQKFRGRPTSSLPYEIREE